MKVVFVLTEQTACVLLSSQLTCSKGMSASNRETQTRGTVRRLQEGPWFPWGKRAGRETLTPNGRAEIQI